MLREKKRDRVVYIPYSERRKTVNEYTLNMVRILQDRYYVTGKLTKLTNISQILKTKAVFLNWIEKELDKKLKIQLLFHQLFGVKIIWVFHNKVPHEMVDDNRAKKSMKWLANQSDVIILHSKSSKKYIPNAKVNKRKAVYVPHIMYTSYSNGKDVENVRIKYGIGVDDFVFSILGEVKPYKNIEAGIEAFRKLSLQHTKLVIAGMPMDNEYARKIVNMCKADKDIILSFKYLTNVVMDNLIDIADVIVLPYKGESSMNSGVMIHAFSKGKTVVAPDICMAKDYIKEGFFYMYHKDLCGAMQRAYHNGRKGNKDMGDMAEIYMCTHNNESIVRDRIYKLL